MLRLSFSLRFVPVIFIRFWLDFFFFVTTVLFKKNAYHPEAVYPFISSCPKIYPFFKRVVSGLFLFYSPFCNPSTSCRKCSSCWRVRLNLVDERQTNSFINIFTQKIWFWLHRNGAVWCWFCCWCFESASRRPSWARGAVLVLFMSWPQRNAKISG